MPSIPILSVPLSPPESSIGPTAGLPVSVRACRGGGLGESNTLALAALLAMAPGFVLAEGLWDRVKEGAAKTYERGADLAKEGGELVREGAAQAAPLAQAGLEAGGAAVAPGLEYGKLLTKDAVDHFYRQGTPEELRVRVDRMAEETLNRLFESDPQARTLLDRSYGYAVFEVRQASLAVTAGYGYGVAVGGADAERIYMKMLTGGVELSKGTDGLASQWVVLLADEPAFRGFVEVGLDASAQALAQAGTLKKGVDKRLSQGMSVYRVHKGGLKLAASLTGTRFWPDSGLNPPPPPAPVVELPAEVLAKPDAGGAAEAAPIH